MSNEYKKVLLISENYLKSETVLDLNVSGNYLQTAIKAAQDIDLKETIGSGLLASLQQKVYDGSITDTENETYKELLDDYIQPFLSFFVLKELIVPISYKVANFGVGQTDDEKLTHSEQKTINSIKDYYDHKANVYKERLQNYLIAHREDFDELCSFDGPEDVYPQLHSSSNSPIWLGGIRGKKGPYCWKHFHCGWDGPNKK